MTSANHTDHPGSRYFSSLRAAGFLLVVILGAAAGAGIYFPLATVTSLVIFLLSTKLASKSEAKTLKILVFVSVCYTLSTVLWPRYVALWIPGLPSLNPTRILNIILVGLLIASALASPILREWWRQSQLENKGIWNSLVALVTFRFFSIIISDEIIFSAYTFINEFLVHVLMFFVGIIWVKYDPKLKTVTLLSLAVFIIVSAIGIIEWRMAAPLFGKFVDPSNAYVEWAASAKMRDGVFRAQSTLGYPIAFAEFVVMAAGLSLTLAFSLKSRLLQLAALAGVPLLLAASVVASGSRSGYIAGILVILGVLLSAVALDMIHKRVSLAKAVILSIMAIIAAVLFTVIAYIALDRAFGSGADRGSDAFRVQMYQRAGDLAAASPLVGYGAGRAAEKVHISTPGTASQFTLDSYYLSLVVDSGIPALLAFLAAVAFAIRRGIRKALDAQDDASVRWAALVVILFGLLLFKSIISIFDNNLFVFAILGCLAAASEAKSKEGTTE